MPSVKFLMARVKGAVLLLCLSCTPNPSSPAEVPAIITTGSATSIPPDSDNESRDEIFFATLVLSGPWNEDILAPRNTAAISSPPSANQGLALSDLRVSLARRDDPAFIGSQQKPHISAAEAAWILDADKPAERFERALRVRRDRFPDLAQRIENGGSEVHVQFMGHSLRGAGFMGQTFPFPRDPMAPTFTAKNIADLALLFSFPLNGMPTNTLEVTLDGCETGRRTLFGQMRSTAEKLSLLLPTAKVRGYLSSTVSDKDGISVTAIDAPPVQESKDFERRRPFPSRPPFAATVEFQRGACVFGIETSAVGAIEKREGDLAKMRANRSIPDDVYIRALDAHDIALGTLLRETPKQMPPPLGPVSPTFSVDAYQPFDRAPYGATARLVIGRQSFRGESAPASLGAAPALPRSLPVPQVGEAEEGPETDKTHKVLVPMKPLSR